MDCIQRRTFTHCREIGNRSEHGDRHATMPPTPGLHDGRHSLAAAHLAIDPPDQYGLRPFTTPATAYVRRTALQPLEDRRGRWRHRHAHPRSRRQQRQRDLPRGAGRTGPDRRAPGDRKARRRDHPFGQAQRLCRRRRHQGIRRLRGPGQRAGEHRERAARLRATGPPALPDGGGRAWRLHGRRHRTDPGLPPAHRRRQRQHQDRLARSHAGHPSGLGRHRTPAATDRRHRCAADHAHRQAAVRSPGAGCRRGRPHRSGRRTAGRGPRSCCADRMRARWRCAPRPGRPTSGRCARCSPRWWSSRPPPRCARSTTRRRSP